MQPNPNQPSQNNQKHQEYLRKVESFVWQKMRERQSVEECRVCFHKMDTHNNSSCDSCSDCAADAIDRAERDYQPDADALRKDEKFI